MALIWIMFILSLIIFGFGLVLNIRYIYFVFKSSNEKAEKALAVSGYFQVLSMILLFLIYAFGYNHSSVKLEREYYGLFACFGVLLLIPFLVIADIKQMKWIKSLSDENKKNTGISMKDRTPLIAVIIVLSLLNMGLVGLNIEAFVYVFQGLLAM